MEDQPLEIRFEDLDFLSVNSIYEAKRADYVTDMVLMIQELIRIAFEKFNSLDEVDRESMIHLEEDFKELYYILRDLSSSGTQSPTDSTWVNLVEAYKLVAFVMLDLDNKNKASANLKEQRDRLNNLLRRDTEGGNGQ